MSNYSFSTDVSVPLKNGIVLKWKIMSIHWSYAIGQEKKQMSHKSVNTSYTEEAL